MLWLWQGPRRSVACAGCVPESADALLLPARLDPDADDADSREFRARGLPWLLGRQRRASRRGSQAQPGQPARPASARCHQMANVGRRSAAVLCLHSIFGSRSRARSKTCRDCQAPTVAAQQRADSRPALPAHARADSAARNPRARPGLVSVPRPILCPTRCALCPTGALQTVCPAPCLPAYLPAPPRVLEEHRSTAAPSTAQGLQREAAALGTRVRRRQNVASPDVIHRSGSAHARSLQQRRTPCRARLAPTLDGRQQSAVSRWIGRMRSRHTSLLHDPSVLSHTSPARAALFLARGPSHAVQNSTSTRTSNGTRASL